MDDGFPVSTTTFSQVIQILEDISLKLKNIFFNSFCREFTIVIKMLEKLITPATNLKGNFSLFAIFNNFMQKYVCRLY